MKRTPARGAADPPWRAFVLFALLCVLVALCGTSPLLAHTVPVEQRVDVDARVEQGALVVHMHIPIDALPGAGLPRSLDARLLPDATQAELDTVAGDAVRNLDIRGDQALRTTRVAASPSADRTALEVDAAFQGSTLDAIDARLNAFQSDPLKPVVTTLHVHRRDGRTLEFRVSGPATRVSLDPAPNDVLSQFGALAAHVVIGWGDQILVLLCLLAVAITTTDGARRVATLLIAQLAGLAVYAVTRGALEAWGPALAVIAASLVVVAGLQTALNARGALVAPLVAAFGLLNGITLAVSLTGELQFAGTHAALAAATFTGFALVAEAWIAAIAFAVRRWLADRGVRSAPISYGVAGFAIHAGLHRFADAGAALAGSDSSSPMPAVVATTLAWAVVLLILAAVEALRRGRQPFASGPAPVRGTS
jgi:hypothetical protein